MIIKSKLLRDTIIQRINHNEILKTDLGEEMVVMDIESGNYISINKIGKLIWELIEEPISIKALLEILTNKFDITEEQCFEECNQYLSQMLQYKLLIVH